MNNNYEINKLRVQQFGLTATIKDDDGREHHFYRGHEYIEIGGLKWAVANIGANTETDIGLYFAFGEKQGYTVEQVLSGERKFTKDEYTNANFDSVKAHWGGKWRLPTEAEFQSLLSSTTNEWVKNYQGSGVNGKLFTDKTDSSKKLLFPPVGFCGYNTQYVDDYGYYWSSSLSAHVVNNGRSLTFSSMFSAMSSNNRFFGFSVRGVIGD